MAQGNGRQIIVHDEWDRRRLIDDLGRTVARSDSQLLSFVALSNHLHLLLKTRRPNLTRAMQAFLSAYALYAARRRRRA
jgi:putative transposase